MQQYGACAINGCTMLMKNSLEEKYGFSVRGTYFSSCVYVMIVRRVTAPEKKSRMTTFIVKISIINLHNIISSFHLSKSITTIVKHITDFATRYFHSRNKTKGHQGSLSY